MRAFRSMLTLTAFLFIATTLAARADTAAFGFTSANFATFDSESAELGYDFTTGSSPILVSALGYINDGFDGTHQVAIFDVATQQLVTGASATVTTVGGDSTSNTFTYTDLASPVLLAANTEYQIVSQFFDTEHYFTNAIGLTSAGGVTLGDAVYDDYGNLPSSPTYAQSVSSGNDPGDFGPNFQITSPVPEPSSFALLGAGLLSVTGVIRRRMK